MLGVSRAKAELMAVPGSFVNSTCSRYQLTQTSSELLRTGNQLSAEQFPGIHQVPHSVSRTSQNTTKQNLPYYLVERHLLYNGFRNDNNLLTAVLAPQKVSVQGPARAEIHSASRYPVVDDHKESIFNTSIKNLF